VLEAYEAGSLAPKLAGEPLDAEGALLDLLRLGPPQKKAAA